MTNEEKLKAMPTEELSDFLCDVISRSEGCYDCFAKKLCWPQHTGTLYWLKQEVNDEVQL